MQGKGWVAAKDLKLNDKLELQNGEDAFVDAIRREKLPEPIQVFNFEVEDFHTYYVGIGSILVDNLCKPTDIGKAGELKAGISKKKTSFTVNERVRIPDYTNKYRKFIVEVKNVRYQSNTLQLRDFADIATQNGYRKILIVKKSARVANTVYKAGWTVHRVL